jgi:cell division protein FtsB
MNVSIETLLAKVGILVIENDELKKTNQELSKEIVRLNQEAIPAPDNIK